MGSEPPYNSNYVDATRLQSNAQVEAAREQGRWDYKVAMEQSTAVKAQAKYDYDARIYEADKNYEIQMEALRVREKEAELDFRVRWKEAQNDAVRAEASIMNAQAAQTTAESKTMREERRANRDERRDEFRRDRLESRGGAGDYWGYGDSAGSA